MSENRCGDCFFWEQVHREPPVGTCRKSLPVLGNDGHGKWPKTHDDEWCGSFKSKSIRSNVSPSDRVKDWLLKMATIKTVWASKEFWAMAETERVSRNAVFDARKELDIPTPKKINHTWWWDLSCLVKTKEDSNGPPN